MDDIFETIVRWRREGRHGALATIVNTRGSVPSFQSARMLVGDDETVVGTIGGGCVEAEVFEAAREVMRLEKPRTLEFNLNQSPKDDAGLTCGGSLEIFVEPIVPRAVLYLFGAGHVGFHVARTAHEAGFEVIVADDREEYANRARFPGASEIHARDLDQVLAGLAPARGTYLVIATRGHRDDMRVLRWAVGTPARYIGMVGSKRKVLGICKELEKEGISGEALGRIHSPIGLDIGAITPEEIAVSVVAELIAVRRHAEGALPHMRRLRPVTEQEAQARSPGA